MLASSQMLARSDNYGGTRSTSSIKWLVYHYTGNSTDTARANARYFQTGYREASAHYFVDETEIIQSVPDNYVAWAVGSTRWLDQGSPYASKGHKYWGIANNVNTISIEMCSVNGQHTAKILENAKRLGQALCELYNIDNAHVIRHFDVNGKLCPITFVTNETGWYNFKKDIGCDVQKGQKPTPIVVEPEKLVVDGLLGGKSVLRMQEWLGTSARDGWISGQKIGAYKYQMNLLAVDYNDGGSPTIKTLQTYLNKQGFNCGAVDGYMGEKTVMALQKFLNAQGFNCGTPDGHLGENTAKAFQRFLNSI